MPTAPPPDAPAPHRSGSHRHPPARIAGAYLAFGVLWIWLSDTALAGLRLPAEVGYWAAAAKGTAFVLLSAAVVYLAARREVYALSHAARLLDAVAEATTDAVVVKDTAGRQLFCNAVAARIAGRDPDRRGLQSGTGEEYEERLTVGGRERTFHVIKVPYRDAGGAVAGTVGVSRDVTDRLAAEEAAARLAAIVESSADAIISKTPDGVIRTWNAGAERLFGYTAAEVVGRSVVLLIPPERLAEEDLIQDRIQAGRRVDHFDTVRLTKDGRRIHVSLTVSPIRDAGGRVVGASKIARDITDRVRAEAALRESEGQFRATFEQAAVGMAHVGLDGRFLRVNERFAVITGRTRDELLATAFQDITHPDDLAADVHLLGRLVAGELPHYSLEKRYLGTGGGVVWVNLTVSLRRDGRGAPLHVISVVEDVSARRQAEEARRASEGQLRQALTAARMVAWQFDPATGRLAVSANAGDVCGLPPGTTLDMAEQGFALVHPDDVVRHRAAVMGAVDGCGSFQSLFRLVRPVDGAVVWMEDRGQAVRGPDGVVRIGGVMIDVTARQAADDRLRASEGRLRLFVDHAPAALAMFDRDMRYLVASRRWVSDYRLPAGHVGRSHYDFFPDLPAEWRAVHARGLAGEVVRSERDSFRQADGTVQWLRWEVRPWHDAAGAVAGVVMMADDITAAVRAEAALRDSEERFRNLIEHLPDAIVLAVAGRVAFCNPACVRLLRAAGPDELIGRPLSDLHPPEWHAAVRERVADRAAADEPAAGIEAEVLRADGGRVPVYVSALPVVDRGGRALLVVLHDLTERNRAAAALRESETRFRTLVENLPDAIFLHAGGRLVFCNPACVRLFGGTDPGQLVGRLLLDRLPPEDHAAILRRVAVMESTGQPVPARDQQFIRLDGTTVWTAITASPVRDGGRPAVLVVLRDLTEQRRLEAQLRQQELMIREAGELAHVGGWGFDPVTLAADWTDEVARIHDVDAVAPGIEAGLAFYVPEDRGHLEAALRAAVKAGTPYDLELQLTSAAGVRKWVRTICRPIIDNGTVTRVRGSIQDISDRKRAEEEIRALNAELEQRVRDRTAELEVVNRELESFSYSVSHDLRAPIRHITGFTNIVLDECGPELPADSRRQLEQVTAAAGRMGRLVDDLLAFSRLGRQPVRRQPVDTQKLVEGCLREVIQSDQSQRIVTRVGDLPACHGDPSPLRQAWLNLLSNAVKYSGRRDPAVIEVGAAAAGDETAYFVRDNGVGFDMRYAHKLFGVFQRLHRADDFEGTGIGLALVQRIVSRHGGRVWAEGQPDKGATFWFTLGRTA